MTPYQKALEHIKNHAYTKGMYMGDAPLAERHKSHFRLVKVNTCEGPAVAVRMYSTDILTVYESGNVMLSLNGWEDSPTTRANLADATWSLLPFILKVGSRSIMSHSQPVVLCPEGLYRYTDDMLFSSEGKLLSKPVPFQARRIDKDDLAEMTRELTESGFLPAFPILYDGTKFDTEMRFRTWNLQRTQEVLADVDRAHRWQDVIAQFKFNHNYYNNKGEVLRDMKACRAALLSHIKKGMYKTILTDTTLIPATSSTSTI